MPVRKKGVSTPSSLSSSPSSEPSFPSSVSSSPAPPPQQQEERRRPRSLALDGTLNQHHGYRHITRIMMNGARSQQWKANRFLRHEELIQDLLQARQAGDTARFLQGIERYLREAQAHVPQAGKAEDIPLLLKELAWLIEECDLICHALGRMDNGLAYVSARILSAIRNAEGL